MGSCRLAQGRDFIERDRLAAAGEDPGADAALILDDAPQYPVDMDLHPLLTLGAPT